MHQYPGPRGFSLREVFAKKNFKRILWDQRNEPDETPAGEFVQNKLERTFNPFTAKFSRKQISTQLKSIAQRIGRELSFEW